MWVSTTISISFPFTLLSLFHFHTHELNLASYWGWGSELHFNFFSSCMIFHKDLYLLNNFIHKRVIMFVDPMSGLTYDVG